MTFSLHVSQSQTIWCSGSLALVFATCIPSIGITDCHALVITTGDGSGNTAAPADDPGFQHVAKVNGASAVYLGNRWLITAAHVGAGVTTIGETEYQPEESHQLTNPDTPTGLSEMTDLLLYRITEDPGLRSLYLSCSTPQLGSEIVMIGAGRTRLAALTHWSVTVFGGDNNDIWKEVGKNDFNVRFSGYQTSDDYNSRWGQNIVSLTNSRKTSAAGDVLLFHTNFEESLPFSTDHEAQAVLGDSGGGVFQKNYSTWELVGVMQSVRTLDNQPGNMQTAVFQNKSLIADVAQYADVIRQFAEFGPVVGDFNQDGVLSPDDIDQLAMEARTSNHVCHFDLTGDGAVDVTDQFYWVEKIKGTFLGDTDLDGRVNFSDFVALAINFNSPGGWIDGDFDGNGTVEFFDFSILSNNFGQYPDSMTASAVPEPSGIGIVLMSLVYLASCQRGVRN